MSRFSVAFVVILLSLSSLSSAQMIGEQQAPTTWDLFGGVSWMRSTSNPDPTNGYGWHTSVSERPYVSLPWVGGTIEASGAYFNRSLMVNQTNVTMSEAAYSFMAGPLVSLPYRRVQPFAHVLLGALVDKTAVGIGGASTSSSTTDFAYALGGGVDVPLSYRWSIRTQADWMRFHASDVNSTDAVRVSAGAVVKF